MPLMTKYYLATIAVDLNTLKQAYLSNTGQSEDEALGNSNESIIQHEMGWLEDSGIELIKVTPIEDTPNGK